MYFNLPLTVLFHGSLDTNTIFFSSRNISLYPRRNLTQKTFIDFYVLVRIVNYPPFMPVAIFYYSANLIYLRVQIFKQIRDNYVHRLRSFNKHKNVNFFNQTSKIQFICMTKKVATYRETSIVKKLRLKMRILKIKNLFCHSI